MFEKVDEIRSRYGYGTYGGGPIAQSDLVFQQDGQSEDNGPLSMNSTMGRLLADEKARAVLEKHVPGLTTQPGIDMVKAMRFKQAAPYSQVAITNEILKAIDEDLSKL